MSDECLRAAALEKAARDFYNDLEKDYVDDLEPDEMFKFATQFAAKREDSAMREAAGLVCAYCANTEIYGEAKKSVDVWNHWSEAVQHSFICVAGPIHERLAEKGLPDGTST